jgi:hypothetical protein
LLSLVALAVGAVFTVQLREKQQQTEAFSIQLREKQQQTEAALAEVEKYRCQIALERGLSLCEQGQAAQGMLWLSHSLKTAPAEDTDLQRDIRVNLAAWRPQVHDLPRSRSRAPRPDHCEKRGIQRCTILPEKGAPGTAGVTGGKGARVKRERSPRGPPMASPRLPHVASSGPRLVGWPPYGCSSTRGSDAGRAGGR